MPDEDDPRGDFATRLTAFRAAGEDGPIEYDVRSFALILVGPPSRLRRLKYVQSDYLRAPRDQKQSVLDQFAAKRFGCDIHTANPELLTDTDIDHGLVHCCGDEDLLFQRCPSCGHIWILCYECDTWHVDLDHPSKKGPTAPSCPACQATLPSTGVESLLPTARQVVDAGLERFLPTKRRSREP